MSARPMPVEPRTILYAGTVGGTVFGLLVLLVGEAIEGFPELVPAGGVVVLLSIGLLVWLIASEPSPHD